MLEMNTRNECARDEKCSYKMIFSRHLVPRALHRLGRFMQRS